MEPPNNGHVGDEHFVHCLEVVPSSEVEMYGQLMAGGKRLSSYWSGGFTVVNVNGSENSSIVYTCLICVPLYRLVEHDIHKRTYIDPNENRCK